MSGGAIGNTTNTGSVGGLGGAMGQPRPQVLPQVTPQVQRPAPQAVPPATNIAAINDFANQQRALGGGPAGNLVTLPPATNIAAINDFANQQRALGGGPAGNLVTLPPATNIAAINDFANQQRALGVGGVGGLGGVGQVPFQGGMPPQLRTQLQTLLNTPGQVGSLGGMSVGIPPVARGMPIPFNQWVQSQNQNPNVPALTMQQLQDKYKAEMTGLGGVGQVPFQAPNGNFGVPGGMGIGGVGQVQQALGGAPVSLHDAYKTFLAQANPAQGQALPTYDQWVQQVSQPKPMPQVFPQKPGLSSTMQPVPQVLPRPPVSPPNPGLGLAGLANMLRGRQ